MKRHTTADSDELAKKSMRIVEELKKESELEVNYQQERESLIFNILLAKIKEVDLDYDYTDGMTNDTETAVARVVSNKPHLFSNRETCSAQICEFKSFSANQPYYSYTRKQMYRASGDVYICVGHGRDHLCTYERCTQKMNTENRDDVRCRLTGKIYGPDISNMSSDQPFDTESNITTSNNPMTTTIHSSSSAVVTGSFSNGATNTKRGRRKKPNTFQLLKDTSVSAPSIAQTVLKTARSALPAPTTTTTTAGAESSSKRTLPPVFLGEDDESIEISALPPRRSKLKVIAPEVKKTYKEILWERATSLRNESSTSHALDRMFCREILRNACAQLCRDILDDREIKATCIQKVFDAERAADRKTNEYLRQCTNFNDMPSFSKIVTIYIEELEPHLRKLYELGAFEKRERWYESTPEKQIQYLSHCIVTLWLVIHGTPFGSKNFMPLETCKAGIFYTLRDGLRVKARRRVSDGKISSATPNACQANAVNGKLRTLAPVVSRTYNVPPAVAVLQHRPAAASSSANPPILLDSATTEKYETVTIEFVPKLKLLAYAPESSDVGKSREKDTSIEHVVASRRYISQCFGSLFEQENTIDFFQPYFLKNHTRICI